MKGQSLVELVITLGLCVVIISAISFIIMTSLKNVQNNNNGKAASDYAQEGMELVRHIRDTDIKAFRRYNGLYCLGKNQNQLGNSVLSCTNPNIDIFIRTVAIEQSPGCGNNSAKITVTVMWNDGKCATANDYCRKQPLISCLSTDKKILAP